MSQGVLLLKLEHLSKLVRGWPIEYTETVKEAIEEIKRLSDKVCSLQKNVSIIKEESNADS